MYPGDRTRRIPIIAPAYPTMCATHDVTVSIQMVMTEEFQKGASETLAVYLHKISASFQGQISWIRS
ncbi:hypothetical protein V8E53_004984 [Lactarius tabidus]